MIDKLLTTTTYDYVYAIVEWL